MGRSFLILLVLAATLATPCVAEEPYVARRKPMVDFASWPGKAGPLKKGLSFALSDYPALAAR
jgi:hypothetical protein